MREREKEYALGVVEEAGYQASGAPASHRGFEMKERMTGHDGSDSKQLQRCKAQLGSGARVHACAGQCGVLTAASIGAQPQSTPTRQPQSD